MKYVIEYHDWNWSYEIEIKHDIADPLIKEAVHFWSGDKARLNMADGDYTQAFLKMLGYKLMCYQAANNDSTGSIISYMRKEEGWPYLDGSEGIKLLNCDEVYAEEFEFVVSKLG